VRQKTALVKQFDRNGDGWLNNEERKAARVFLRTNGNNGRRGGPRRPRGGFNGGGETQEAARPGTHVAVADAKSFPSKSLYAADVLRTFFLEFENSDWEKELEDFHATDVDVPAKLTVDGKVYSDVGVHFRGASSYMMVETGRKRSLNLSMDYVHEGQQIGCSHTLNLLNSHEDPTFLRSVLSYQVARDYMPAPKANFVRLVINGESWGLYVNVEQFNKDFAKEWFGSRKGARWKVPGSPNGRGSLAYLGEDAEPYKRIYQIKSKDDSKSWEHLIKLCKVLTQTPAENLAKALEPLLDIDGALKFLALQNVLINNDGYWIRTSDYDLFEDEKGRFHVLIYDSNENFSRPEGPGFGGGPGGPRGPGRPGGSGIKGVELDPLTGINDESKPLISKLLAVPVLRTRYLGYVRDIAEKWLDWKKLGPVVEQYQALIDDEVKKDTRKLYPTEAFLKGIADDSTAEAVPEGRGRQPISLKAFAEQRRAFLLNDAQVKLKN